MTKNISRISKMHYAKLVFRSFLFVVALAVYFINRFGKSDVPMPDRTYMRVIMGVIWLVFAVEMVLRFFPSHSRLESMGCQKQFKRNYIPRLSANPKEISKNRRNVAKTNQAGVVTFAAFASWIALNAIIGMLYFADIIDQGIMVLIALAYSVCDMICILFFCPFQTWIMKNKCCTTCRIYNWDYAMMFTPFIFTPNLYTWSLLGMALILLLRWEITYAVHPEYFSETTNACLSCVNCKEKLCQHKKQLRVFLKKNKKRLKIKGNEILNEWKQNK